MRIRSERANVEFDTDQRKSDFKGGEGEIYVVPPDVAAKVYDAARLDRQRQEKVLALCSKYDFYRGILNRSRLAFPQYPVANVDDHHIVGFTMQFFGRLPLLSHVGFDIFEGRFKPQGGRCLTDDAAVALIYDLYEALESFRRANVALGDVHPDNILYDWESGKPVFVDIDSAHIEHFPVTAFKDGYVDPQVDINGVHPNFTYLSDRFSMAIVAYELFVGRNPFFLRCDPNEGIPENKRLSVSLLGHHRDRSYMERRKIELLDTEENRRVLDRLGVLKTKDSRLYEFLCDVLLGSCRDSLLQRLPRTDPRHPANLFISPRKRLSQELAEARQADVPATKIMDARIFMETMMQLALREESRLSDDPKEFIDFVTTLGIDYLAMSRNGINVA